MFKTLRTGTKWESSLISRVKIPKQSKPPPMSIATTVWGTPSFPQAKTTTAPAPGCLNARRRKFEALLDHSWIQGGRSHKTRGIAM